MEYEKLSGIRNPLSRIVFGTAIPDMLEGKDVDDFLTAVYREGITTFDTAENYGRSEVSIGHWLKSSGLRDKITIISKGCHPYERNRVTAEDLKHDIENSFKQLGTDYIDIYLLHRDDMDAKVGPIVEILNEYFKAGKIGRFGASNWTCERIQEANDYAAEHGLTPFSVSSPNFGLCDQIGDPWGGGAGCVTISGPSNEKARQWYIDSKIPVFAYSSLGRGLLSGRVKSDRLDDISNILDPFAIKGYGYPENYERLRRVEKLAQDKGCTVAQIALKWIMVQNLDVFPIISTTSIERLKSNIKALDIKLTEDEAAWVDLRT